VSDRVFVRRAYLDAIGLLPMPESWMSSGRQAIRANATAWSSVCWPTIAVTPSTGWTFWNDALRNDYRGTGYIDAGGEQITDWLYSALATNMPFNEFVRELIDPLPQSAGFSKGIVGAAWSTRARRHRCRRRKHLAGVHGREPEVRLLPRTVSSTTGCCQIRMDWPAYFSDQPLEMAATATSPTGQIAKTKFIYPELR